MSRVRTRMPQIEYIQRVINEFSKERADKENRPFSLPEAIQWALDNGKITPMKLNQVKAYLPLFARAARTEKYIDPQGRSVRRKHAVRYQREIDGRQRWFSWWRDVETAEPDYMRISYQQRRTSVVGVCAQLKTDVDSYNDNNRFGAQISMDFNIDADLQEMEMPKEYPDKRPEGEAQSS